MVRAWARVWGLLPVLAVLSACEPHLSRAQQAQYAELQRELPGVNERCLRQLVTGDERVLRQSTDECFAMSNRRRWVGIWFDDFEGQSFCERGVSGCTPVGPGSTWIEFVSDPHTGTPGMDGKAYAVEFDGRRTVFKGSYGHVGAFEHEIIVDRLISIREVERAR